MSILRAMATVGGLTMVSRVAGFVRDVLTAGILGAGPVADAFFVALKLPNLFRRLFAEGAFSVSFVPMYAAELQRGGDRTADRFAEEALALMVTVLVPLTVGAILAMPWIVTVIAPGFIDDPEKFATTVAFCRITFPYLMMIAIVALLGGVLNARDRFAPFASAPILFNLSLIAALTVATPHLENAGQALSYAVAAAGALQLVWLALWCRAAGVRLVLRLPRLTPRVRRLVRLMGPGAFGAGVTQINLFFDVLLASLLPTGAISYLYYADRLYQLPLGVIGIAIGTAILPVLSRQVQAERDGEAAGGTAATLNRAIEFGLLLAVPAAIALAAIPGPILAVLFERGAFGPGATAQTAAALAAYAIGIPAYVLVKVLSTAFFARQDTATPVRIAVVCTVLNIALSFTLIWVIAHVGIALATGLTAWLNVGLLLAALRRRGLLDLDARLGRRVPRLFLAGAGMAIGLVGLAWLLRAPLDGHLAIQVPALAGLVLAGAAAYFGLGHACGALDLRDVRLLLRRRPLDRTAGSGR